MIKEEELSRKVENQYSELIKELDMNIGMS